MAPISMQCPNCSAPIQLSDEAASVVCSYCGGTITRQRSETIGKQSELSERSSDQRSQIRNLMDLAARELKTSNRAKADELYSKVLELDAKNSEAWCGRATCANWEENFDVAWGYWSFAFECSRDKELMLFGLNEFLPEEIHSSMKMSLDRWVATLPESAGTWFAKAQWESTFLRYIEWVPTNVFLSYKKAFELAGNDERKKTQIQNALASEAFYFYNKMHLYGGMNDGILYFSERDKHKYSDRSQAERKEVAKEAMDYLMQCLTLIQELKLPLPHELDTWWKANNTKASSGGPAKNAISSTKEPVPEIRGNRGSTTKSTKTTGVSSGSLPLVKPKATESHKYYKRGGIGCAIWILLFALFGTLLSGKVIAKDDAIAYLIGIAIILGAPAIVVVFVVGLIKRAKEKRG